MIKQYKKYIAESKNIVYISTVIALVLRCGVLFSFEDFGSLQPAYSDSFVWSLIAPYFSNIYFSFACSFVSIIGLAAFGTYINNKYNIIRRRTSLPFVFIIFLCSCFPPFTFFSPLYFGIFFILLTVNILYEAYQKQEVAYYAFQIGFMLALGCLFTPDLIFYLPLYWIGFSVMRSFNIKVILASLLGVFMVGWPLACFLIFWQNQLSSTFVIWYNNWQTFNIQDLLTIDISDYVIFAISVIIIISIMIYNSVNSFKDKIQARAYLIFFNLLFICSVIISSILLLRINMNLMLTLIPSAFIYSHFFALTEKKAGAYFFIVVIFFYLTIYSYYVS